MVLACVLGQARAMSLCIARFKMSQRFWQNGQYNNNRLQLADARMIWDRQLLHKRFLQQRSLSPCRAQEGRAQERRVESRAATLLASVERRIYLAATGRRGGCIHSLLLEWQMSGCAEVTRR